MKKLLTVLLILCSCKNEINPIPEKLPVEVKYFNEGDTLYPDYACQDTLIVIDAKGLNKAMELIEQGIIEGTDESLDSTFHCYCRIK